MQQHHSKDEIKIAVSYQPPIFNIVHIRKFNAIFEQYLQYSYYSGRLT